MAKPKPKPAALEAFNIGFAFHEGSLRCGTDVPDPNSPGTVISPLAPTLVNAAFAAELYMKALVLRREPKVEGHNLSWLFRNALDEAERQTIAKHYRVDRGVGYERLLADLEGFARAFVEWRYVYESSERMVEADALLAFVRAAYLAVREIAPEWPVTKYLHERFSARQDLARGMYVAEGATLEQALDAFGVVGPQPDVTKGKDGNARRPAGWAILNHQSPALYVKVRRGPGPKDGGAG